MPYNTPEPIEELVKSLEEVIDEFFFLQTCKEAGQPYGEHLDTLLEDALAHLADKCEEFNENFTEYIKK